MAAEKLVREGYQLIVVGESGHPEVEGIMGHADERARVVSSPADLDAIELSRKVGVVVQTTQTVGTLSADRLRASFARGGAARHQHHLRRHAGAPGQRRRARRAR